jgi:protein tyrosine phosphatase
MAKRMDIEKTFRAFPEISIDGLRRFSSVRFVPARLIDPAEYSRVVKHPLDYDRQTNTLYYVASSATDFTRKLVKSLVEVSRAPTVDTFFLQNDGEVHSTLDIMRLELESGLSLTNPRIPIGTPHSRKISTLMKKTSETLSKEWISIDSWARGLSLPGVVHHLNAYALSGPFEVTRVHIKDERYIDASYVEDKSIIATELPQTGLSTRAFWQMVWDKSVRVIVVLTPCDVDAVYKGVALPRLPEYIRYHGYPPSYTETTPETELIKNIYWPDHVSRVKYAQIESEDFFSDAEVDEFLVEFTEYGSAITGTVHIRFNLTRLEVINPRLARSRKVTIKETRSIDLYHYVAWSDNRTPSLDIIDLLFEIARVTSLRTNANVAHLEDVVPFIVHCNAGVGRTGSFIMLYIMLRHIYMQSIIADPRIDTIEILTRLRKQRQDAISSDEQYVFCCHLVEEMLEHIKIS